MEDQLFADREGKTTPVSSVSQFSSSGKEAGKQTSAVQIGCFFFCQDAMQKFLCSSVTVPQNALLTETKKSKENEFLTQMHTYAYTHKR